MTFSPVEYAALLVAFGLGAIVPGADFAMVLRNAVLHGRRTGLATAAGIGTAVLVHGAYTILGLGLIVGRSAIAFEALKLIGAAYLLWLGVSALRAPAPRPAEIAPVTGEAAGSAGQRPAARAAAASDFGAFVAGFLTNLTNPKVMLFFLALFTSIVGAGTDLAAKSIYVGSMAIELFAWFALVSVIFTTEVARQGFYKLGRWFNRITGATFILLAAGVAVARQS